MGTAKGAHSHGCYVRSQAALGKLIEKWLDMGEGVQKCMRMAVRWQGTVEGWTAFGIYSICRQTFSRIDRKWVSQQE